MKDSEYTIIHFKNGKLLRDPCGYNSQGEYVSSIPFAYSRDGRIMGYDMGTPYFFGVRSGFMRKLISRFFRNTDTYSTRCYSMIRNNVEVIQYVCPEFNVTYYVTDRNSYVLFGGFGSNINPYTHFYDRGFGEAFEDKMTRECYEYVCTEILTRCIKMITEYSASGWKHHLRRIQSRLGFRDNSEIREIATNTPEFHTTVPMPKCKPAKAQ